MASERKLTVILAGDSRGLTKAIGDAEGKVSGFGSKVGKFAKGVGLAMGGGAIAAVALGKSLVDAAIESQKVTKQTEAVITSTGKAAGVSAKQVASLSTALSLKTGIDDELIQSGENVLLTFTGIKNAAGKNNDIFNQSTKAALNMSVALGTDMTSASMLVGKALNDPVAGLSKLTKSGVVFTDQQKDQIKWMAKSGDTAGAQKIMLAELNKEFGGSAEAQATAGEKLKVAFGNLQEELGARLLPIVEKVAGFLAKNLPGAMAAVSRVIGPIIGQIQMFWKAFTTGFTEDEGTRIEMLALRARDAFAKVRDALKKVADFVVGTVLPALGKLGAWIIEHKPVLAAVAGAIGGILVAAFIAWASAATAAAVATIAANAPLIAIAAVIGAVVASVIWAYKNWGWFHDAVDKVAKFLSGTLWPILQAIAGWIAHTLIPTIGSIISTFLHWAGTVGQVAGKIIGYVAGIISWVRTNWPLILAILTGPIGLAVLAIARNWDTIKAGVTGVKNWIVARFNDVTSFLGGLPGRFGGIAVRTWESLKNGLSGVIRWIRDQIDRLLGPLDEIAGKVGGIVGKLGGVIGHVPGFAAGVSNFRGGLAVVGESGPELVRLPRGSDVIPNPSMMGGSAMGGGGVVVHLDLRGAVGLNGPAVEKWVRDAVRGAVSRDGGIPGTNIVKATA